MKKKEKHRKYFGDHFVMIYIDQPKQENNIEKVIPFSHPKTIAEAEAITDNNFLSLNCSSIDHKDGYCHAESKTPITRNNYEQELTGKGTGAIFSK